MDGHIAWNRWHSFRFLEQLLKLEHERKLGVALAKAGADTPLARIGCL